MSKDVLADVLAAAQDCNVTSAKGIRTPRASALATYAPSSPATPTPACRGEQP